MKKIFTLMTFVCTTMFATNGFSQIAQSFESQNDITILTSECWTFSSVNHVNQNAISGAGSIASQVGSISQITTPYLNISTSITISFDYQRIQFAAGSKTLKILLLDTAGTPTLLDNLTLNDGDLHSYSGTFTNANTPGNHFPLQGKIRFEFSDNVGVTFDDLTITAPYYYAGGCSPQESPLPVKLISFQGNKNENKVMLQWTVATNETADRFEIERSENGKDFAIAGMSFSTTKYGAESYSFNETVAADKVYYRLKMYDKSQFAEYSKILVFQAKIASTGGIKILNNPAIDKLTLNFFSAKNQPVDIKVYDINGRMQMSQKTNVYQGNNMISLVLNSSLRTGMYIVEVNNGSEPQSAKFIKQ